MQIDARSAAIINLPLMMFWRVYGRFLSALRRFGRVRLLAVMNDSDKKIKKKTLGLQSALQHNMSVFLFLLPSHFSVVPAASFHSCFSSFLPPLLSS